MPRRSRLPPRCQSSRKWVSRGAVSIRRRAIAPDDTGIVQRPKHPGCQVSGPATTSDLPGGCRPGSRRHTTICHSRDDREGDSCQPSAVPGVSRAVAYASAAISPGALLARSSGAPGVVGFLPPTSSVGLLRPRAHHTNVLRARGLSRDAEGPRHVGHERLRVAREVEEDLRLRVRQVQLQRLLPQDLPERGRQERRQQVDQVLSSPRRC